MDVGRWSWAATHFCRVAATEFSRGFEPTDRGATQSSPSRQRRMNAVRRGFVRVESTQGVFPVAIPFTSQGLYSTVADATGGFQPGGVVGWSRDDSSVAMRR